MIFSVDLKMLGCLHVPGTRRKSAGTAGTRYSAGVRQSADIESPYLFDRGDVDHFFATLSME